MKKRLLALLLAVAMCISLLPVVALAEDLAVTLDTDKTSYKYPNDVVLELKSEDPGFDKDDYDIVIYSIQSATIPEDNNTWTKLEIEPDESGKYTIEGLTPKTYYYFAELTPNGEGDPITSSVATVPVAKGELSKPDFTVSGTEKVKADGVDSTVLTVNMSNESTFDSCTYEWKLDGTSLTTDETYTAKSDTAKTANYSVTVTGNKEYYTSSSDTKTITVKFVAPPTINTHPQSCTVGKGSASAQLSVSAESLDDDLTYQWEEYKNAEWLGISGETSATYAPPADETGVVTYHVVVTDSLGQSTDSNAATVTVKDVLSAPTITNNLSTALVTYTTKDTATALAVTAAPADEADTLSYQWYESNSADSAGTAIDGETSATYTPSTATAGEHYYYVKVTASNGDKTPANKDKDSLKAHIIVYGQASITVPPQGATYVQNASASNLSVTAYGLNMQYQWQKKVDGEWLDITGATASYYKPSTETIGDTEYRVAISDSFGTICSDAVTVTVTARGDLSAPTITSQPNSTNSFDFAEGESAPTLTVTATAAEGDDTLSYQWQVKNGETFTNVPGAIEASYTPSITAVSKNVYKCVVTSTNENKTPTTKTAETGEITVYAQGPFTVPTITTDITGNDMLYIQNGHANAVTVAATAAESDDTLSYQWQVSTDGTVWTDLDGADEASFTPPTDTIGEFSYRVIVTAVNECKYGDAAATSGTVKITVVDVNSKAPVCDSLTGAVYFVGDTVTPLTINVTNSASLTNVTYQWYKADSADGEGYAISGATEASYTPTATADDVGAAYYYAEVTNNISELDKASAMTSRARILVVQYTVAVSTENGTVTYLVNGEEITGANAGDTITGTASALFGYTLTGVQYTDDTGAHTVTADENGAFSFEMPASNVTISVTVAKNTVKLSKTSESVTVYEGALPTGSNNSNIKQTLANNNSTDTGTGTGTGSITIETQTVEDFSDQTADATGSLTVTAAGTITSVLVEYVNDGVNVEIVIPSAVEDTTTDGTETEASSSDAALVYSADAVAAAVSVACGNGEGHLDVTYDAETKTINYTYTLTNAVIYSGDSLTRSFKITVTDDDGNSAVFTLSVVITDDQPYLGSNFTSFLFIDNTEGITFNVLNSNNSTGGADGATFAWTSANTAQYGTMTLNADGSFTYVVDHENETVKGLTMSDSLQENYSYTYTDADGDVATGSLGVMVLGFNSNTGAGDIVDDLTTKYTISFETNGGTIDPAEVEIEENVEINLGAYIPKREGYNFAGWYSDEDLTTPITTVTMTADVIVYADWKEAEVIPEYDMHFNDVSTSDWFYDDVYYCCAKGLMNGMEANTFQPYTTTTRAMAVTLLFRLEGEPEGYTISPFTDVPTDVWYSEPIAWAASNGIVDGVADRIFDPDGILTREQFATILYRYATLKGYDTASSVELGSYPDSGKISTWALDALKWANAMMLVTGTTDANGNTILDPQGYAQRCQAAAVLHRFSVNVIPVEEPSTDDETTEDTTTDTETAE